MPYVALAGGLRLKISRTENAKTPTFAIGFLPRRSRPTAELCTETQVSLDFIDPERGFYLSTATREKSIRPALAGVALAIGYQARKERPLFYHYPESFNHPPPV